MKRNQIVLFFAFLGMAIISSNVHAYTVSINGTAYSSSGTISNSAITSGTVTWDATNGILTLNNATLTASGSNNVIETTSTDYPSTFTVALQGTNQVIYTGAATTWKSPLVAYLGTNLTITGPESSSLYLQCNYIAVMARDNTFTIKGGCSVTAQGGYNSNDGYSDLRVGSLVVNASDLTISPNSGANPGNLNSVTLTDCRLISPSGSTLSVSSRKFTVDGTAVANGTTIQIEKTKGSLGSNCTWNYNPSTGVLSINGTGSMPNYQAQSSRWFSNDEISSIVIGEGVTSVGSYTFAYDSNLATLTLPSTLTSIGSNAFYGSPYISTIYAKSVPTFGTNAFDSRVLSYCTVYASNADVARAYRQAGFSNVLDESSIFTIYLEVTDEGTPLNLLEYEWTSVSVYDEDGLWLGNSQQNLSHENGKAPLKVIFSPYNPDELVGKTLVFRLNVSSPQNETPTITDGNYIIHPQCVLLNNAVTTVTYTPGGVAGTETKPVTLNYVALQRMNTPSALNLKVGETVCVEDLFTYTPSNASIPSYYLNFEQGKDDDYVRFEMVWTNNQVGRLYVTGLASTSGLSNYNNSFKWYCSNSESGTVPINVSLDPNDCLYYLDITADGSPLEGLYYSQEQNYITVQPFIDGVAYGEPLSAKKLYESTYSEYFYYYVLSIPANLYGGKTIEFHVIPDYSEEYYHEIDGGSLPMHGEYIVNTISYNNYTSNTQIPVKAGTVYGSIKSPVLLNFINLNYVHVNSVTMNVGESVDLNDYCEFEPSNASMPVNFSMNWYMDGYEEFVRLSGTSTLTGVSATSASPEYQDGIWPGYEYTYGDDENGGEFQVVVNDPNMMTVWLDITDEGAAFENYAEYSYLEVSAFANGDSLGVSTFEPVWSANQDFYPRLKLSFVPNNPTALKGKELTFHLITSAASAFDGSRENATIETDGTYIIHPSCVKLNGQTTKITYQPGKTWGTPEVPVILDYVNLNGVTVQDPIQLQVGQTVVMDDYVTYNPTNASVPVNFKVGWSSYGNDGFSFGQSSDGKTTLTAKGVIPQPGFTMSWNAQYQFYGNTNLIITDPNNCYYILTIKAEGEPLNHATWNISEMNYITVTPYINGTAIGEPQSVQSYLDFSSQVSQYYFYYVVKIPASYAGNTVEFHVTTDYDEETLYEIDSNSLPMSGEYIIRDVAWSEKTTNYIAATMPVTKGKEWGTITNPVVLNYVTPTSISTTPASLSMTVGDTYDLKKVTYTFNPQTSSVPVSFSPEWTVGNYVAYMSVDKNNVLTALKETNNLISIEGYTDNYTVSIPVTISARVIPVTGVTISDANKNQVVWLGSNWREAYLPLDDLYQITPSDASNQDVTWTSSDESVAEINSGGNEFGEWYAMGKKVGTAVLTVTTVDGAKTATLNLEVRAHVTGIELMKESVTVNRGSTNDLSNYIKSVLPADAYDKSVTWAVTDTSTVVTVDQSFGTWRMKANRVGTTTLQVTSVDNPQVSAFLTVIVESKVTGITISDANKNQVVWLGSNWREAYLPLDDLYKITPSDAANQDVTWTSSDESVVEIGSGGNEFGEWYAMGKKVGTAVLTVTTVDGGKTATLNLEVRSHVTGIELKKESVTVNRGSTNDLSNYIKSVLPADAYDKSVTWAVTDTSTVVTVDQSFGTWRMKANRAGTTNLKVTSVDNPEVYAFLTVNVESKVTGITILAENQNQVVWLGSNWMDAYLPLDDLYQITPSDASNQDVTWTSSDESVVEIGSGGNEFGEWYAMGKKVGTAVLTVTTVDGGKTATLNLEVRAHVTGIELKKESVTVNRGSTTNLSNYIKSVLPTDAYDKSVTWAVTDTSTVVTVDKSYDTWRMKANRTGTAYIKVTSVDNPDVSVFLTVIVESKVTDITIPDANKNQVVWLGDNWMDAYLPLDDLYQITPSDASNQDVTWTSSDESVAEINSGGNEFGEWYAVGKKVGTAVLTVKTADGGKTATLTIEVRAHVKSITLTTQSITVNRGSTVDLSKYIQSVLPANAYDKSVKWTSGNTAVVSINGSTAVANAIGSCRVTATSVDNPNVTATMDITVEAAASGIYATNPVQTVWIGEEVDLSYYFVPADATSRIKSWTSSDPSVVAVSGGTTTAYRAVAQKSGTAVLTVTTDNGQKATIQVTVHAHVSSIELTSQSVTVNRGSTTGLSQYIKAVLPADAYDKSVTWAVTDTATVVTVSQSKDGTWQMTANRVGFTTLRVVSVDNPQAVAFLSVEVESKVTGITVEESSQILYIGEYANLNYTIQPSDATNKDVTWKSSDNTVVKVEPTPTGYSAVAQKVGTATLTATTADGGKTATININVRAHVESITLTTQSITVNRGSTVDLAQYIQSVLPANAYDKSVKWTSGNPDIVSINGSIAMANAIGSCRVIATSVDNPQATAVMEITVEAAAEGINVDNPVQTVWIGEEVDLGYYFVPADATSGIKSWTSSDPSVVLISGNGTTTAYRAVAQKSGKAVLTVTTDNGQTATIQVTVLAHVEAIRLTVRSVRVNRGTTTGLDQYIDAVLPEDAYDKSVTWAVSDTSTVVSVSQSKNGAWQMTANRVGTTTLQVTSVDNPQVTALLMVMVESVSDEIQAEEPEQTIWIDEEVNLNVTFDRPDATTTIASWTSSNPEVVKVTETEEGFMAVGISSGEAVLTVTTDNGLTATIEVTVHAHVDDMTTETTEINIQKGETVSLDGYLTFQPADAYNKDVVWTSEDENVVSVAGSGTHWTATGKQSGSTTLTVTSVDNPDVVIYIEIHVTAISEGIIVAYPKQRLPIQSFVDLSYTLVPEDASQKVSWSSSDPDVVSIEVGSDGTIYAICNQKGTAVLTVTTEDGHSATIEVEVYSVITGIEQGNSTGIGLVVGESCSLSDYLSDPYIMIYPEDADDKRLAWSDADDESVAKVTYVDGEYYVTGVSKGSTRLTMYAVANPSVSVNIYIRVVDAIESFKVNYPEQTVYVGNYINLSYTITPESASDRYVNWTVNATEPDVCTFSWDPREGYVCWPTKAGSFYVVGTPDGIHYDSIHVTAIRSELEGIRVEYNDDNIMKGDTLVVTLLPVPEHAAIDASKLTYKTPEAEGGWKFVDVTMDVISDEEIQLIIATHTWGYYTVELGYPGMEGDGDATTGAGKKTIQDVFFNVGQHVELEKGWNWITLAPTNVYQGSVDAVAACFDNKILDARTQKDLLYYDPDFGYFGTLYSLAHDSYKINVSEAVDYKRTNVTYTPNYGYVVQLKKGWNWIEYPYDVDYSIEELLAAGALGGASYADRIVSKDGGFTEWSGYTWFGDLKMLHEDEGYMYYSSTDHDLTWPAVTNLDQKLDKASGAQGRRTVVGKDKAWSYDHRRFADNMTIIADVKDLTFPDDCSIGAFVNGECRGEGHYVDGHFFITVHGQLDDVISFIIHDAATDTYYTVPGTLNFDMMAGSLQHPIPFKVGEKTTDIEYIRETENADTDVYDLVGRKVVSPATGFYIKNGKKVFMK